jgi:hypothetical protein
MKNNITTGPKVHSSTTIKGGLQDLKSEVNILREEIQRLIAGLEFCIKPGDPVGYDSAGEEIKQYSFATHEILDIKEQIVRLQRQISYTITVLDIE